MYAKAKLNPFHILERAPKGRLPLVYFLLNNLFNEYLSTFTSFPIFFLFQILTISLIKMFPPFYRFSILISPIQGGNK